MIDMTAVPPNLIGFPSASYKLTTILPCRNRQNSYWHWR